MIREAPWKMIETVGAIALLAVSLTACGPDRFRTSYPPLAVRARVPSKPKPAPPPEPEEPQKIAISEKIRFRLGSFEILEDSFHVLDHVAQVMKDNPEIKRVEVQGHTDHFGSMRRNMYVSRERAKAVRRYLIEQGVAPTRLDARGYGPNQPVADNETAEGREKNRRVEFVIVEGALAHNG
jgi:OOP family OmpA-OmpF porin